MQKKKIATCIINTLYTNISEMNTIVYTQTFPFHMLFAQLERQQIKSCLEISMNSH